MADRFEPLLEGATIFRLAEPSGGHLPAGSRVPNPDWLAPTLADKDEAARRGRVPALSAWQVDRVSPRAVRALTGRARALAFAAGVAPIRETAARVPELGSAVDVLHDPADEFRPQPGWDAHAIVEGLHRPDGRPRGPYRELRARLVALFERLD